MDKDDSAFDDLLKRYLNGEVSEEERVKIEAWLDSNKSRHGKRFTWDKNDEQLLFERITSTIHNVEDVKAIKPRQRMLSHRVVRWLAVAASVTLIATASFFVWQMTEARRTYMEITATREQQKVITPDGSIIWLTQGSTFSYFTDKKGRHTTLKGKALFEVSKNKALPFNVSCGMVDVVVTGTSFTIDTAPDQFALHVLTGVVKVAHERDTIVVKPLEQVAVTGKGAPVKTMFDKAAHVPDAIEYNMIFRDVTMADVMRKIEDKFDVTLIAEDARLKNCRITADFTDRSLESTLQMLSEVLDINFNVKGAQVVITGAGCE